MNKKIILFASLSCLLGLNSIAQKTTKAPIVGAGKDKHGCITSAGYTYSELKHSCIKIFEEKIQLKEVNPKGTSTSNVAVVFSKDEKKAELFLPTKPEGQILTRIGKKGNYSWKNGDLFLLHKKEYVLKIKNKIAFSQ